MRRRSLKLREQIVRSSLQRFHFSVVCHRAGVVEHQRDAKTRIAPGRDRHRADVDLTDANDTEKICVDHGGAIQGQFRTAGSVGVGVTVASVTSGRLKSALKVFVASVCRSASVLVAASLDIISAVESNATWKAVRAAFTRV